MKKNPSVFFFGVGAIGASVGAWVGEKYPDLTFFDRPEIIKPIAEKGLTAYLQGRRDEALTVKARAVDDLAEAAKADLIVVAVKNYSLEGVAAAIKKVARPDAVILAIQNGIENQRVLPRYFDRVVYCVISYNAWLDGPGVVGYQKRGSLIIGTPDGALRAEADAIAAVFNLGVETIVADRFQDAVHSKMIVNLTNSFTTLIDYKYEAITDMSLFQKILTNMLHEGVTIVKSAGFRECRLGGLPSWMLMTAGAKLPQFLTRAKFSRSVRQFVISSMAQDIIQRKGTDSELDTINGYLLGLARKNGIRAPYNETVYALCKERFGAGEFKPMTLEQVWARIAPAL